MKRKSTLKFGICITIFALVVGCAKDNSNNGSPVPAPQPGVTYTQDGRQISINNNCTDLVIPPYTSNSPHDYCSYLLNENIHHGCNYPARSIMYKRVCLNPPVTIPENEERTIYTKGSTSDSKPSPIYSEREVVKTSTVSSRSSDKSTALLTDAEMAQVAKQLGLCDTTKPLRTVNQQEIVYINKVNSCGKYNYLPDVPGPNINLYLDLSALQSQGIVSYDTFVEACTCLVDYRLQTSRQSSRNFRDKLIAFCLDSNGAPNCKDSQKGSTINITCNPAPVAKPEPVNSNPVTAAPVVVAVPSLVQSPTNSCQQDYAQNACLPLPNRTAKLNIPSILSTCEGDKCLKSVRSQLKRIFDKIDKLKNHTSQNYISTRIRNADYERCEPLPNLTQKISCVTGAQKSGYPQERSFYKSYVKGCLDKTPASNESSECISFIDTLEKAITDSAGPDVTASSNKDVCPMKSIRYGGEDSFELNGKVVVITNLVYDAPRMTIVGHYLDQEAEVWITDLNANDFYITTFFNYAINCNFKKVAVGYHIGFVTLDSDKPQHKAKKKVEPAMKQSIRNSKADCEQCNTPSLDEKEVGSKEKSVTSTPIVKSEAKSVTSTSEQVKEVKKKEEIVKTPLENKPKVVAIPKAQTESDAKITTEAINTETVKTETKAATSQPKLAPSEPKVNPSQPKEVESGSTKRITGF